MWPFRRRTVKSACWQVDKAERREECVTVAVVTLGQQGAGDQYLLLQRPKEGLLAGGDYKPSAVHPATLAVELNL